MITAPKGEISKEYVRIIGLIPYKVYSKTAPNNAVAPYVIINSVKPSSDYTKDSEGYEIQVSLMVVSNYHGSKQADEISSIIQKAIITDLSGTNVTLADYNISITKVVRDEEVGDTLHTPTQSSINDQILVFTHKISQKR
jgi:hypothetical protein